MSPDPQVNSTRHQTLAALWSATTAQEFGQALAAFREHHAGLSIRQVATQSGVGRSTVSEWERGSHGPRDFELLEAVLSVLGIVDGEDLNRCRAAYRRVFVIDPVVGRPHETQDINLLGWLPAPASVWQPRTKVLAEIEHAWEHQPPLRERTVVLSGPGGCGKTQIALAVMTNPADPALTRLWLPAGSRQSLVGGLVRMAATLPDLPPHQREDRVAVALAVLEWLSLTERPWLVVLDGLEDPRTMTMETSAGTGDLWPRGLGRVLVTSRHRGAWTSGAGRRRVDVGSFAETEATDYLARAVAESGMNPNLQEQAIGDLCRQLGNFPLALAQAAAFMQVQARSCSDYASMLTRHELTTVMPADYYADGYERTIDSTWQLSAHLAASSAPHLPVRRSLTVAALVGAVAAPERLWCAPSILAYLDAEGVGQVGESEARRALRELHAYNLVDHRIGVSHTGRVTTHLMTQRAVWESLSADDQRNLAHAVAAGIIENCPRSGFAAELAPDYADIARSVLSIAGEHLWNPEPHALWLYVSEMIGSAGWISEAVDHLSEVVDEASTVLGPHHAFTLEARVNRAHWRIRDGKTAQVQSELLALRDECEQVLGPVGQLTLQVRCLVARSEVELAGPAQAIPTLTELVDECERVLGEDHWASLWVRNTLERAYCMSGQWQEALPSTRKQWEVHTRLYGPLDQQTLLSSINYGRVLTRAGDATHGRQFLHDLIDPIDELLGRRHMLAILARTNYAEALIHDGESTEGMDLLTHLHLDTAQHLGDDHPLARRVQTFIDQYRGEASG